MTTEQRLIDATAAKRDAFERYRVAYSDTPERTDALVEWETANRAWLAAKKAVEES